MQFYLVEGQVLTPNGRPSVNFFGSEPGQRFQAVVSGREGLIELISEFYRRASLFYHRLNIREIHLCKTLLSRELSREQLVNNELTDSIWSETMPNVRDELNLLFDTIESCLMEQQSVTPGKLDLATVKSIVGNLVRPIRIVASNCCEKTVLLVESTATGRPVKVGLVNQDLAREYQLSPFHIVSIFQDFTPKTVTYQVDHHPFGQVDFGFQLAADLSSFSGRSSTPSTVLSTVERDYEEESLFIPESPIQGSSGSDAEETQTVEETRKTDSPHASEEEDAGFEVLDELPTSELEEWSFWFLPKYFLSYLEGWFAA
jgi:hypothetical protein